MVKPSLTEKTPDYIRRFFIDESLEIRDKGQGIRVKGIGRKGYKDPLQKRVFYLKTTFGTTCHFPSRACQRTRNLMKNQYLFVCSLPIVINV